jgi:hypothetical protein
MSEAEVKARNEAVPHRLDFGEYGFLQFQQGPREVVGVNGLFIEENVLPALVTHLQNLQWVLPSLETEQAIQSLRDCIGHLNERHRLRTEQKVMGTYKEHQS